MEQVKVGGHLISYEKKLTLAQGTFGEVFLVDVFSGKLGLKRAAAKYIFSSLSDRAALREKLQALCNTTWAKLWRLKHNNVVRYLGAHVSSPASRLDVARIVLIMEYCPGGSLTAHLGKIQPSLLRIYCRQLLDGLSYLHHLGIVHTDIKPHNILVEEKHFFGAGTLKICDLDDPVLLENGSTKTGDINKLKGSMPYFSPEMAHIHILFLANKNVVHVGRKTDIWSLGIVVLDMAALQYPREIKYTKLGENGGSESFAFGPNVTFNSLAEFMVAGGVPVIPEHLPGPLREFVNRCLNSNEALRPTADELLLDPYLSYAELDDGCNLADQTLQRSQNVTDEEIASLNIGLCYYDVPLQGGLVVCHIGTDNGRSNSAGKVSGNSEPDISLEWDQRSSDCENDSDDDPFAEKSAEPHYGNDALAAAQESFLILQSLQKRPALSVEIGVHAQESLTPAGLSSLFNLVREDVMHLKFVGLSSWKSVYLSTAELPTVSEITFQDCDVILQSGHFSGLPQLRTLTFINSVISELEENVLAEIPKLIYFGINVACEGSAMLTEEQLLRIRVHHVRPLLLSAKYAWLRDYLRLNPQLTVPPKSGQLWTFGNSKSAQYVNVPVYVPDHKWSYLERSTAMPVYRMERLSLEEQESFPEWPHIVIHFATVLWEVSLYQNASSADVVEACKGIVALDKSHPIKLYIYGERKRLWKDIADIEHLVVVLWICEWDKFDSFAQNNLRMSNVLEIRLLYCLNVILEDDSLDGFSNLRAFIMQESTAKVIQRKVFHRLEQLQVLILDYFSDISIKSHFEYLLRLHESSDYDWLRTYLDEKGYLTEAKGAGEIWHFTNGNERRCNQRLSCKFVSAKEKWGPLIGEHPDDTVIQMDELSASDLASVYNEKFCVVSQTFSGILNLEFFATATINDIRRTLESVMETRRKNPISITLNCRSPLPTDLFADVARFVVTLTFKSAFVPEGSWSPNRGWFALKNLVQLHFLTCSDVPFQRGCLNGFPKLRMILLEESSFSCNDRHMFSEVKDLAFVGLHFNLRYRFRVIHKRTWSFLSDIERQHLQAIYFSNGVERLITDDLRSDVVLTEGEIWAFGRYASPEVDGENFTADELASLQAFLSENMI